MYERPVRRHEDTLTAYGARPVSVDLTRGSALDELRDPAAPESPITTQPVRVNDRIALDRLPLKHWPRGHRVLVCSLAGGTGRTTLAAAMAATLAGLRYAHIWPPVLLVDGSSHRLDAATTQLRPVSAQNDPVTDCNRPLPTPLLWEADSGVRMLAARSRHNLAAARTVEEALTAHQDAHAPVIIDTASGLPSDLIWTRTAPAGFSVVLMTRPDQYSLAEAAEALVWMHDRKLVTKHQVTVVVNHGIGITSRRTRPAATALAIRCHAVHQLTRDPGFAPGPPAPITRPVPKRQRGRLTQICLSVWHTTQTATPATVATPAA
jgi:hypothetical protein